MYLKFEEEHHDRDYQDTATDPDNAGDNPQGKTPQDENGQAVAGFFIDFRRLGGEHPQSTENDGDAECHS